MWLPTDIFDFDVMPCAAGPTKQVLGGIDRLLALAELEMHLRGRRIARGAGRGDGLAGRRGPS